MKKIKVTLLNKSEHNSDEYLSGLTRLTYSEKLNGNKTVSEQLTAYNNISTNIIENVVKFNHTSILEHTFFTFMIEGASRSFLSQMTRHRLFSFTSGSQHYINYSKIGDFVIPIELLEEGKEPELEKYIDTCNLEMDKYRDLVDSGIDHSVARQVLPNAMRNNLIVSGNLRQYINFLNQRLCGRNTSETHYIAHIIYKELEKYNPVIMKQVGPDCVSRSKCTQGHKTCGIICDKGRLDEKFKKLLEGEN